MAGAGRRQRVNPGRPGHGRGGAHRGTVSAAGTVLQTLWLATLALVWLLTRPGASGLRRTLGTHPSPGDPPSPPPPGTR